MTLRDFTALSRAGKTEIVELWGEALTEKMEPGYRIMVYRLFDFYVEEYHSTSDDLISRYRACFSKDTVCS